jgi:toxin FitB
LEGDNSIGAISAMTSGFWASMSKLAVRAAIIGLENRMPMADSIIMATARAYDAVIWTQDEHFKKHAQVKFYPA